MLPYNLEDLKFSDIEALKTDATAEGVRLDYKEAVVGSKDSDKVEFLTDVASFANAVGGDIVFGVAEAGGVPTTVDGLEVGTDVDKEILRMTQMVHSGLEPHITVQMKAVAGPNGRPFMVLRIPRYWSGLVMVKFGGAQRFYGRRNTGKVPLDVHEIRAGFLAGAEIGDRARHFRDERVWRIRAGEAPVALSKHRALAVHFIPASAFAPGQDVDLKRAYMSVEFPGLHPANVHRRYNIDGVLVTGDDNYSTLYRSGIVETVSARFVAKDPIPSKAVAISLVIAAEHYMKLAGILDIAPPVFVFATLFGVKGLKLGTGTEFGGGSFYEYGPIDRDEIFLPDVVIDDFTANVEHAFRPMLDGLWQAAGLEGWAQS